MIRIELKKLLDFGQEKKELDVSLELSPGSITALVGPSGSGKTSVLKMIAGLMVPDKGKLEIENQIIFNGKENLRAWQRPIGFISSDLGLFPNMTVQGNLNFALPDHQDPETVQELAMNMGIDKLMDRHPDSLSTGQKQRVLLARTLLRKPSLLLLDEPFNGLDQVSRGKIQNLILNMHSTHQPTILLVSHDVQEIEKIADRVIMLSEGLVVKTYIPGQD